MYAKAYQRSVYLACGTFLIVFLVFLLFQCFFKIIVKR